jgi:hypothetical protein
MKKIIITVLVILGFYSLNAQEIMEETPAVLITRFPIKQYSGGVMVIRARFANIPDTLNFILDTGSGGISLDSATCAEFHIAVTKTDTSISGIGGIKKVPFVFDQTLHLPNLDVKGLNFHVNDYEVLTSVYGEKVDGIIGYSFFSRYIVSIDLDNNMVEVYKPGKFPYRNGGTILRPIFTSLPIQWMEVKDRIRKGFNFYFDTGAGLCFLMSERFMADSSILLSKRKPVLTQAEGMGGRLKMRLTVVKEVKIGPYRFRRVPTYLFSDEYNVTSYPFVGGLVGSDLLRRFNIILNYPRHEIHLIPNSHFTDGFDYSYTGLGVYFIDGKIMVEDVIDGSPADKAGFKHGDIIVAVNNNFSGNILQYKNLLQNTNEFIRVIIMRGETARILLLKTERIF